jgi:cation diffusion facilitator family transporter
MGVWKPSSGSSNSCCLFPAALGPGARRRFNRVVPTRLKRNIRVVILGLCANAALTAAKLTAGLLGHSHGLTADAVESCADILGSALVWRGVVVAARPADEDHPYGHGKAEAITSAAVATLLLLAAAAIASQSLKDIFRPRTAPEPWTLAVLVCVIAIKEVLFRLVIGEGRRTGNSAVQMDAWHHRSDAVTSLAASVGILVSWIGGSAWSGADTTAALFAAAIIAWNGWRFLRPALEDLMDATASPEVTAAIRRVAAQVPGVENIEKCRARRMGGQLLVDMHLWVPPDMTVARSHEIAHRVKDAVRREIQEVDDVLIHIEPAWPPAPPEAGA